MSDLTRAVSEVKAALPKYRQAHGFYDGSVNEVFSSPLLARLIGSTARDFNINLARRVVDAVLDRLKIGSITVADDDTATAKLNEIFLDNKMGLITKRVHRVALSEGDAYMVVWPDTDGDSQSGVEIYLHDPTGMRVFYDEDDPHEISYAAQVWQIKDGDHTRIRVNLLYADRIERYISNPDADGSKDAQFDRYVDPAGDDEELEGSQWPIPNPFGRVPVFHFRTDEPYGRPEHKDAFGPQLAITKLVATHMATVDFQGFPQRYRLKNSNDSDRRETSYPLDDAEIGLYEQDHDRLEASPGTVWDLLDTQAVGQLEPAPPASFLDPINFYARAMGASTATPLRFLDPSGAIPSGESLRADEAPLVEKIEDRQTWFEDTWRELYRFALLIVGIEVPSVEVTWMPVETVSDLTGWQTTKAKVDAGVPQEVALAEAGYLPSVVDSWSDGAETTNLATRIDLLTKIGTAMQGLGTAVSLGVLSEAQVQAIVSELLNDVTVEEDESAA